MAEAIEMYDVCLSFAGEQRGYVDEVAMLLRDSGLRVFYDEYETADLWGRELYTHLDEIYNHRSRYCILFASADYARKVWPSHERESAQARAMRSNEEYVLPVRFDDTRIPGLRDTIGYLDAHFTSPAGVVAALHHKLEWQTSSVAAPVSVVVLTVNEPEVDLGRLLDQASDRCGITGARRSRTGPLLTTVLPAASCSIGTVMNSLVPELISAAEDVLRLHTEARLRIGVHADDAPSGREWDSAAVTTIVRCVNDSAVGDFLARAPRGNCVVVVSQQVYDKVLRPDPGPYEKLLLSDGRVVYARSPGYLKASSAQAPEDPKPQGGPGKYTFTFNGHTEIGRIGDGG
jgi:hypothetical protein